MKSIARILTCVLAVSLGSQAAVAGCLDKAPTTQYELDQQMKSAKMRYEVAISREKNFAEIARDAELTNSQSKIVAGLSVAPVAFVVGANGLIGWLIGGSLPYIATAVGAATGLTLDATVLYVNLKRLGFSDVQIGKITQEQRDAVQSKGFTCSFKAIQNKITVEREKILATDLSGSFLNRARNAVTLGSVDKKALINLVAISGMERELIAAEMKELSQVKIERASSLKGPSVAGSR